MARIGTNRSLSVDLVLQSVKTYIDYTIGHYRNGFWIIFIATLHANIFESGLDASVRVIRVSHFDYIPLSLFDFKAISH